MTQATVPDAIKKRFLSSLLGTLQECLKFCARKDGLGVTTRLQFALVHKRIDKSTKSGLFTVQLLLTPKGEKEYVAICRLMRQGP